MKKIYLIAAVLLNVIFVKAQNPALPNQGFEFWTQSGNHLDPDNWNTLNNSTGILGIFTATRVTDAHSGSYAIKLQTKLVFGQIANGIASTGTIITTPPYGVTGGIPYTGRPDSIAGWYKYTPVGTDSGFVQFSLLDANADTIGFIRWSTPNTTVSTYTRFSSAITYLSNATPVTSQWILSASRGSNPFVNSAMQIDDLQLIFKPIVCSKPTNTSVINITSVAAKLKWGAVAGAISYKQKFRAVNTLTWTYKTSTSANKQLTGLVPGTTYEWAVQAKCSSNPVVWGNYSTKKTFTTLSARDEQEADAPEADLHDLVIFPNPAHDVLNLSLVADLDEMVSMVVYNAIGQVVITRRFQVSDGMLDEQLDVSGLKNGIYLIAVNGSKFHSTKRLLIQ